MIKKIVKFFNTLLLYSYFIIYNYFKMTDFSKGSKEFSSQLDKVYISLKIAPLEIFNPNWKLYYSLIFIQLISVLWAVLGYSFFGFITAFTLLVEIVIQENPFNRTTYFSFAEFSIEFYVQFCLVLLICNNSLNYNSEKSEKEKESENIKTVIKIVQVNSEIKKKEDIKDKKVDKPAPKLLLKPDPVKDDFKSLITASVINNQKGEKDLNESNVNIGQSYISQQAKPDLSYLKDIRNSSIDYNHSTKFNSNNNSANKLSTDRASILTSNFCNYEPAENRCTKTIYYDKSSCDTPCGRISTRSQSCSDGPRKSDGSLDMRYSVNRGNNPEGIQYKMDGTPDKRYSANKKYK